MTAPLDEGGSSSRDQAEPEADPLRVRLFSWVDRTLGQGTKALTALHRGLWLGLLDRAALHRVTALQYRRWPKYRGDDYNESGLWTWEELALERYFSAGSTLLVAAAGGGREMLALAARGFHADGFDCASELVESCRRRLANRFPEARVLLSPPDTIPSGLALYDGMIFGWGAYTHIVGSAKRIALLDRLRRHLRPRAPVLLSFFVRPERSRQFDLTYRVAGTLRRLRRDEPVERGDTLDRTYDHFFVRAEIERELDAAGFDLLAYSADCPPHGHAVGRARR